MPDIHGSFAKRMSELYMREGSQSRFGIFNPGLLWEWTKLWPQYTEGIVNNMKKPEVRSLEADVMIISSFSSYILAHLLDIQVVQLSPFGPWSILTTRIGNQFFPSQTPTLGGILNRPELLEQRLANLITTKAGRAFLELKE